MVGLSAELHKMAYNEYPGSIQEFKEYLDGETIDDEWGTAVNYERINGGYAITSAGPDRKHGTSDDMRVTSKHIENWNETAIREITN